MTTYPKKIESTNSLVEEDSIGFTEPEKIALKNSWKIVKLNKPVVTIGVLYEFLIKYPKYFEFFKKRGRTDYNIPLIHAHPQRIFKLFDSIIEENVSPVVFLTTLKDFHTTHRFLECEAVHLLALIFNNHVKVILKRYMTPTLDEALDKLCMAIVYNFESNE